MQANADTDRLVRELLNPGDPGAIKVFDLTRSQGQFQTSDSGFPLGTRSFGFWSFLTPKQNDLVVIQRPATKVCYLITSVDHSQKYTGDDGNKFWCGVMIDIVRHGQLTTERVDALQAAGLA